MVTRVTEHEEKILKNLLALAPLPEITFSYYNMLGYLYGIAITPALISPNEWIPIIFGDEMPEYESEDQARQMLVTVLAVLNKHISAFQRGSLTLPFDMETLSEKNVSHVWEWTSGFEEALSLRPECWEEDQERLTEDDQGHLVNSLIVIEGVAFPDQAIDMFDHISKSELTELGITLQEDEIEKVLQVQEFLLQGLELSVATIQSIGAKLDRQRQSRLRSSAIPFPGRSSTVGKNESCPCGSGRKYKTCCGRPAGELNGYARKEMTGKKGKVIKVDFPQHGKTPKKKKQIKQNKQDGPSYQLEISLAYSEPSIWRRIQVPSSMTLADLHLVIQYCMGWQDMHMHHFQIGLNFYGPQMADDYAETVILDESRFTLDNFEMDLLRGIVYTYDFGDNWEHVVMLEKVIVASEAKPYPVLVEAARACPPEDIGGISGFQYYLETLADPEHEELANLPGLQGYTPDHVDIEAINHLLQMAYGKK